MVAVVMVVVVMMMVGVRHCIGSRQTSNGLLHMGIVWRRLHLQRSLRGIGLMAVRSPMTTIHEMITKESSVTLWRNTQSKTTSAPKTYSATTIQLMLSLRADCLFRNYIGKNKLRSWFYDT